MKKTLNQMMAGLCLILGASALAEAGGGSASGGGNGGDGFVYAFRARAVHVLDAMRAQPAQTLRKLLSQGHSRIKDPEKFLSEFERVVRDADVSSEWHVYRRKTGKEVDAINDYPNSESITLSRTRWLEKSADCGSRDGLVLHEYLSLLGIEVDQYKLSPYFADILAESCRGHEMTEAQPEPTEDTGSRLSPLDRCLNRCDDAATAYSNQCANLRYEEQRKSCHNDFPEELKGCYGVCEDHPAYVPAKPRVLGAATSSPLPEWCEAVEGSSLRDIPLMTPLTPGSKDFAQIRDLLKKSHCNDGKGGGYKEYRWSGDGKFVQGIHNGWLLGGVMTALDKIESGRRDDGAEETTGNAFARVRDSNHIELFAKWQQYINGKPNHLEMYEAWLFTITSDNNLEVIEKRELIRGREMGFIPADQGYLDTIWSRRPLDPAAELSEINSHSKSTVAASKKELRKLLD